MTDSTVRRVAEEPGRIYFEMKTGRHFKRYREHDDGTHALLPWTEHQAMVRDAEVVEEARILRHRLIRLVSCASAVREAWERWGMVNVTHERLNELCDALDALRGVREEELEAAQSATKRAEVQSDDCGPTASGPDFYDHPSDLSGSYATRRRR